MHFIFSPQRRDDPLELIREGDVLIFNGTAFDFSDITEGDTRTVDQVNCPWVNDDVTRTGGVLQLSLILPHGSHAPHETLFPAALDVTIDGPVDLPAYDTPVPEIIEGP